MVETTPSRLESGSLSLSDDAIAAYRRDGFVVLRGALGSDLVPILARGLAAALARPSLLQRIMSAPRGGFHMETFLWVRNRDVREVAYRSPLAQAAAQLMGSRRICLYDANLFAKRGGTSHTTVLHEDSSYMPVVGEQLCCMWVPTDSVRRGEGALEFLPGSHRNPPVSRAAGIELETVAIEADPGDVLAFDCRTLHGASSAPPAGRDRTAIVFRWVGDDVRFDPRPECFPVVYRHGLRRGDAMQGPVFPQLFPAPERGSLPGEGRRLPLVSLQGFRRMLGRTGGPGYKKHWKVASRS